MEENRETPKEVVYEYDGYADGCPVYDVAHCPICDYEFENGVEPWGRKYCPKCGQRLKWKWFDAINDNVEEKEVADDGRT